MTIVAGVVLALQISFLLLTKWFEFKDEEKQKVKEILKEVPNAKTVSDINLMFSRINRVR